MIDIDTLIPVIKLLLHAAHTKTTVSYQSVFKLFHNKDTAIKDMYDTLEAACRALAPYDAAIFSALLADKEKNMPGANFFEAVRSVRPDEYLDIGADLDGYLSDEQKIAITYRERKRVYRYAKEQLYSTQTSIEEAAKTPDADSRAAGTGPKQARSSS